MPEVTEEKIRIPVLECDITATIDISAKDGIQALYCGKEKQIATYLFDAEKWTMDEAKGWIEEHAKSLTKAVSKSAIPYKKTSLASEAEEWEAVREVANADVDDLKIMCAIVEGDPENKGSYKLPHHKAGGEHACIWHAVAACAAVLMGDRGGVDTSPETIAGAKRHIASHYQDFEKDEPPWLRKVEKTQAIRRDGTEIDVSFVIPRTYIPKMQPWTSEWAKDEFSKDIVSWRHDPSNAEYLENFGGILLKAIKDKLGLDWDVVLYPDEQDSARPVSYLAEWIARKLGVKSHSAYAQSQNIFAGNVLIVDDIVASGATARKVVRRALEHEPSKIGFAAIARSKPHIQEEDFWLVKKGLPVEKTWEVPIWKSEEQRFVYGIVLQPDIVDAQGDIISKEEIAKTAHQFMENCQKIGVQHNVIVPQIKIWESYLAPQDITIAGQSVIKGSWVLGVHILDDEVWGQVKKNELTGFSIKGFASTRGA